MRTREEVHSWSELPVLSQQGDTEGLENELNLPFRWIRLRKLPGQCGEVGDYCRCQHHLATFTYDYHRVGSFECKTLGGEETGS